MKQPVYQVVHSFKLRVGRLPPIPDGHLVSVWMPIPTNATDLSFTHPPTSQQEPPLLGCSIAYWDNILPKSGTITASYHHDGKPRVPQSSVRFFNSCLAPKSPLTKISEPVKKYAEQFRQSTCRKTVKDLSGHLIGFLDYAYPPLSREAEDVMLLQMSDCGGYHALFVAALRHLGIPSCLDFGWRVGVNEPHVWAYWYDNEKKHWSITDLNDDQEERPYTDRVSMTLGTNPKLIPPYPLSVTFLQGGLAWYDHLSTHLQNGGRFAYETHFSAISI